MRLFYWSIFLLLLLFPSIDATDKESTIIKISASDNNIQTNTVEVYASLRNSNGQPVSNQLLIFYVNNQIFASNITNDNGDSSIQFQALEEVYEIQVRFDGSESYKESESEIIIIQKIDENNNVEQNIPNELLVVISLLTLGIAGSGILYYLTKISKREL